MAIRSRAGRRQAVERVDLCVVISAAPDQRCSSLEILDAALSAGVRMVQLGVADFPVRAARSIAPHLILGAKVSNVQEARDVEAAGVDYVAAGPVFPSANDPLSRFWLGPMAVPVFRDALDASKGNQTQTARLLDISRDTLRYRMKKYGLAVTRTTRT
ncbi:MAG: thiamine phosphate synthase [Deltaproteobacteria bacterium]|nr:thiamine phosphate synthase [Deltaproteobacteria bacterium]